MRHQGTILGAIVVALGAAGLVGAVATDAYSRAAGAEARGYQALVRQMEGTDGGADHRVGFAAPASQQVGG
jgi:hypothetical protein